MGNTANRLRELHPSRYNEHEVRLADVADMLQKHFGGTYPPMRSDGPEDKRPDGQTDDIRTLIVSIGIAASEEARRRAGHESRKDSLAALRALYRLPDDKLIDTLLTCDGATFDRIQTAHAELYYVRNGIPVIEIPDSDLSDDDWIAACNGDAAAYVQVVDALNAATDDADEEAIPSTIRRSIELPRAGQPLHLPMGIDGLKQAIANAITVAVEESKPNMASEKNPKRAGNKPKPHADELARACEVFMRKYHPAPNIPGILNKAPPSPAVGFATDVFGLAGMTLSESRIEELLTEARKPRRFPKL